MKDCHSQAFFHFQALRDLANERILSFPYTSVPTCWRRLYTDASLLKALAMLQQANYSSSSSSDWGITIQDLDKALIVAGAPRRLQITCSLIRHIQDSHLPRELSVKEHLSPSKTRPNFKLQHPITRHDAATAPSLEDFLAGAKDEPFIISGAVKEWPAFCKWSSLAYLRSVAGPGRVVPIEVGGTYTQETWTQTLMDFDVFLDALAPSCPEQGLSSQPSKGGADASDVLYLAQHDLLRQLPSLEDDIWPPDYVHMAPSAPTNYPSYHPPDADRGYLVNLWVGPADTHSPAHTDPYFNCFCASLFYIQTGLCLITSGLGQVVGRKLVWIAPPSASPNMYPYGSPDAVQGDSDQPDSVQSQYMTNTTQVDVLATCETTKPGVYEDNQTKRFPRFFEFVAPVAQQAVLEPGDMLYLPPGWWHALKSLDSAISVSLWF